MGEELFQHPSSQIQVCFPRVHWASPPKESVT